MTKEDLRTMFQENARRSEDTPAELREVINTINSMAYKLCGTMLVNCGDSPELTTAIRRVHEGSLSFHEALVGSAKQEANARRVRAWRQSRRLINLPSRAKTPESGESSGTRAR